MDSSLFLLLLLFGIATFFWLIRFIINKSGKPIQVRGRYSSGATIFPKDYQAKQEILATRQLKALGLHMEIEDELLYYETGDDRIIEDYKLFPVMKRWEIDNVINRHSESNFSKFDFLLNYQQVEEQENKIKLLKEIKKIDVNKIYSNGLKYLIEKYIVSLES